MSRIGSLAAIALFFAALSAPLAAGLLAHRLAAASPAENRALATAPDWPASRSDLLAYPSRVDAFANDNFPFRPQLVALGNRLRYDLFREVTSLQITIGHDDRLFFNSHTADDPLSMIRFLCGEGSDAARVDSIAQGVSEAVTRLAAHHPASTLMFVPTKSTIDFESMPAWLQQRCRQSAPVVPRVLARLADLAPVNRTQVYYPVEAMRALRAAVPVYQPQNFHWLGAGARAVADETAAKRFRRPRRHDLAVQPLVVQSDLQQFLPGIALSATSEAVDFAAAGITACRGGSCLPELGEAGPVLGDIGRFHDKSSPGPRLLILSDSFGSGIAGYFAPYFGSVWHVSVSGVPRLSAAQKDKVRRALVDDYAPDQILYVFHDFSIQYFDISLKLLL